jgi:hypothetical protein
MNCRLGLRFISKVNTRSSIVKGKSSLSDERSEEFITFSLSLRLD